MHNLSEGLLDHSLGRVCQILIDDGQSPEVFQPGERALHDHRLDVRTKKLRNRSVSLSVSLQITAKLNRTTVANGNFFTTTGEGSFSFNTEWDSDAEISY